ncbi:Imm1 family immunity protein [Streptoalloteichus hindustanus]|uniref:Immunity protein Imm1 n=1 Tax=Streptoalloteichus hindustanus TaxID=2017 RepID=A0A1M5MGL7_STRHI|nr:Imm1 family immunity protein [Streptoalloteichus hindustanus]SHG76460.1 Immunity protein Imm1 [Streptoalloteichus hindustanus]
MTIEVMWRTVEDDRWREHRELIRDAESLARVVGLLEDPRVDGATAHHPSHEGFSEMVFGVRNGRGALFYTDAEGAWYTLGEDEEGGEEREPPVWFEVDFPPRAEVPAELVAVALDEYRQTGQRPTVVRWQPMEL